jgi:hypothetical protein
MIASPDFSREAFLPHARIEGCTIRLWQVGHFVRLDRRTGLSALVRKGEWP